MNIPISASRPDFVPPMANSTNASDFMIRRDYLSKLEWPTIVHVVFPVLMPLIGFLGIVGNSLTIAVLWHNNMKSTVTTVLFRTLVISDIGVVTFWTINGVSEYYLFQYPEGGSGYLDVFYPCVYLLLLYLIYLFRGISIWITVTLCLERFIFVCYPHRVGVWCAKRKAKLSICVIVAFFAIASIQQFIEFKPVSYPCGDGFCYINHFTEIGKALYYSKVLFWFNMLMYNIIPTVLLLGLSLPIVYKLFELYRKRKTLNISQGGVKKRELHVTIVLLVIVFFSILCNLNAPYFVSIYVYDTYKPYYAHLMAIFNIIVVSNSSINFVVYGIVGERFRKIFLNMCKRLYFRLVNRIPKNGDLDDTGTYSRDNSQSHDKHLCDKRSPIETIDMTSNTVSNNNIKVDIKEPINDKNKL